MKDLRCVSLSEVCEIIPYSRSQIWRLERQGRFPKRVRIGPNRVAWLQTEIESWLNKKLKERGQ
jgi:prophage regulatory protein